MIEQVVDNYILKVQKAVLNEQMKSIPLAYLLQQEIPKSIKHYFDQEVENWIAEEQDKFSSADRFDYDMPEVRMKIDDIFDLLKNNANFTINKFNQLLERAVKLERDFTIKPHQTMTNFLFKKDNKIITKQVIDILRYFFVFDYYNQRLSEYFNLKYMREINLEQFKELIKQIDEKIYQSNMVEESINMVKAIIEFVNKGSDEKNKIDTVTLISAFEDRNLTNYFELFSKLQATGKEFLSIDEIEKYIREGIPSSAPTTAPVKLEDIDVSAVEMKPVIIEEEEEEEEEEEVIPPSSASPASTTQSSIPSQTVPTSPAPAPAAPVSGHDHFEQRNAEKFEQTGQQFAQMFNSNIDQSSLEDLNVMISKDDKKTFIKKVFKKDENFYNQFIETLNGMSSWKDASIYIEDIFYEKDVNPYSDEATLLSDICYERFFPKK